MMEEVGFNEILLVIKYARESKNEGKKTVALNWAERSIKIECSWMQWVDLTHKSFGECRPSHQILPYDIIYFHISALRSLFHAKNEH